MWVLFLELIGVGLVLAGVGLWSVPAAVVLAGVLCLSSAFALSRVKGEK